jgi:hypothetical protein
MPARNELQKNNIYLFKFARVMSEFGECCESGYCLIFQHFAGMLKHFDALARCWLDHKKFLK